MRLREGNGYPLFRNSAIEGVDTTTLDETRRQFGIHAIEERLEAAIEEYLTFYRRMGVFPPALLYITFLHIGGFEAFISRHVRGPQTHIIDRDILQLPEVLIEDFDLPPAVILKPAIELLFSAFNFDHRIPRRS